MRLTSLSAFGRRAASLLNLALFALAGASPLRAQGGEAELRLPDLGQAVFMNGVSGPTLLTIGLGVAVLGLVFGMAMYSVSKRVKEFGIRVALGAQSLQLMRTALARPVTMLLIGSAVGLILGVIASIGASGVQSSRCSKSRRRTRTAATRRSFFASAPAR